MRNIWDDRPSKLKNITDEMIAKAEQFFGIRLPPTYINLLKIKNGGGVKYDAYPTSIKNSWADDRVPFDQMAGIDESNDGLNSIYMTPYMIKEWDLPSEIILLSGNGHRWIVLDYRHNKHSKPAVTYLDVDSEQDFTLTNSFDEFVQGLKKESDFEDA